MAPQPETRHTPQRRAILAALKLSSHPLTAEEVFHVVRRRVKGLSVSTVYRNLDLLAGRGEIFRMISPNGTSRFAGSVQPQEFFTCLVCERTEPAVIAGTLAFFQRRLPAQRVLYATTYLQGRCSRCSKRRRPAHA